MKKEREYEVGKYYLANTKSMRMSPERFKQLVEAKEIAVEKLVGGKALDLARLRRIKNQWSKLLKK